MRKSLIVAFALSAALVACGNDEAGPEGSDEVTSESAADGEPTDAGSPDVIPALASLWGQVDQQVSFEDGTFAVDECVFPAPSGFSLSEARVQGGVAIGGTQDVYICEFIHDEESHSVQVNLFNLEDEDGGVTADALRQTEEMYRSMPSTSVLRAEDGLWVLTPSGVHVIGAGNSWALEFSSYVEDESFPMSMPESVGTFDAAEYAHVLVEDFPL